MPENVLKVQGKGGYYIEKKLDEYFYKQLKYEVEKKIYNIKYTTYIADLKGTINELNEEWTGSHGFRYNYAQNQLNLYQKKGYSLEQSKYYTSLDLGHRRPEIIDTYL